MVGKTKNCVSPSKLPVCNTTIDFSLYFVVITDKPCLLMY